MPQSPTMAVIGANCVNHQAQGSLDLLLYKLIIFQCKKNTEFSVKRVHSIVARCQTSVSVFCLILSLSQFLCFFFLFHRIYCLNFISSLTSHYFNKKTGFKEEQGQIPSCKQTQVEPEVQIWLLHSSGDRGAAIMQLAEMLSQ